MPTEEFFEAEFHKFIIKLNRILAMEEKELLHFSFQEPGFVDVAFWDKKTSSPDSYFLNIEKQEVHANAIHHVQETETH
jgi:hypothetical protein